MQVWYHSNCANKGKGCSDTRLVEQGGCCIWFNEPQFLADIEDHLNVTLDVISPDMKVPVNQLDGKVTYGQRAQRTGSPLLTTVG